MPIVAQELKDALNLMLEEVDLEEVNVKEDTVVYKVSKRLKVQAMRV